MCQVWLFSYWTHTHNELTKDKKNEYLDRYNRLLKIKSVSL